MATSLAPFWLFAPQTSAATISKTLRRPNNDLGLVAYWTLDGKHTSTSTSGVLDISGNGKHGTLFGLGGGTTTVETLVAGSYFWRAPVGIPGVKSVQVELWGGGGSGGGQALDNTIAGAGGGAGGQYAMSQVAVNPGTGYSILVAATRAGVSGGNGLTGNSSTFNSTTVVAAGGAPGLSVDNGSTGGAGSATGCVGTVCYAGGSGANGGVATASGGGGGGAGSTGVGGNASGSTAGTGTTQLGGNGGAGRSTEGTGNAGSTTAGGGGGGGSYSTGGTDNEIGGTGAAGRARLTYLSPRTVPAPIAGRVGQGLQFAPTSTSNAIMGNVYNGVQSVSFWMKQASSTMTHGIVELNSSTRISWASGAITTTGITSPTVYVDGVQTSALNDFNWHHVTVTTATPINADAVKFGSTTAATNFSGALDDVRLYSRELTADDVQGVYHVGATSKTSVSLVGSSSLQNGLVGWWTMDGKNLTPNVRDSSGQGNHGNLSGFTSTTTAIGKLGQALQFDGVDDYVDISGDPAALKITGSITIAGWFNAKGFGDGLDDRLVDKFGNGPDGYSLAGSDDNGPEQFYLAIFQDGKYKLIYSSTTFGTNRWYHVVGVYDASSQQMHIYVDGVLDDGIAESSGTVTAIGDSSNDVNIGIKSGTATGAFNGAMDDLRIYNRVLSASEVQELYSMGASSAKIGKSIIGGDSLANGLVGYWTFDGPNMLTNVRDTSGQGNHGNLFGFTSTTTEPGRRGQALNFDGSDDYVRVDGFTAPSEGTFAAWLTTDYNEATCCSSFPMVFVSSDPRTSVWYNGSSDYFALSTNSSLTNRATYSPGGDVVGWFHLAVTWSSTGSQFYRDGEPVGTPGTGDNSGASGSTFYLGTRPTLDRWHDGDMDDVRVYNRVLSNDEIRALYRLGR